MYYRIGNINQINSLIICIECGKVFVFIIASNLVLLGKFQVVLESERECLLSELNFGVIQVIFS